MHIEPRVLKRRVWPPYWTVPSGCPLPSLPAGAFSAARRWWLLWKEGFTGGVSGCRAPVPHAGVLMADPEACPGPVEGGALCLCLQPWAVGAGRIEVAYQDPVPHKGEGSRTRPSPQSGGRPGLACFIIIPGAGPWWAGCLPSWMLRDVGGCGGGRLDGAATPQGPCREARGVQGPSPGTPGSGKGCREVWGWGRGRLPGPQTDGSNFQSRGAGLSCGRVRRGPRSVSRKQPQSRTRAQMQPSPLFV